MAAEQKNPTSSKPKIYDTTDHGLQQGTFLLNVVQEVAKYAPIPYLQNAAGSCLFLVNTVAVSFRSVGTRVPNLTSVVEVIGNEEQQRRSTATRE